MKRHKVLIRRRDRIKQHYWKNYGAYKYKGKTYPDIAFMDYDSKAKTRYTETNENIPVKQREAIIKALDKYEEIRPGTLKEMADDNMIYEHDDTNMSPLDNPAQYTRLGRSKYYPVEKQKPIITLNQWWMPGAESNFFHEFAHAKEDMARIKKGKPDIFTIEQGWVEEKNPAPFVQQISEGVKQYNPPVIHKATGPEARAEHFEERMEKQKYKRGVETVEVVGSTEGVKHHYAEKERKLKEATKNLTPEEKAAIEEMREIG